MEKYREQETNRYKHKRTKKQKDRKRRQQLTFLEEQRPPRVRRNGIEITKTQEL
tara:strand:+ start:253 stop:414 length:162 start_codon:yes stop_codon:yes gene_type:complete